MELRLPIFSILMVSMVFAYGLQVLKRA